MWKQSEKTKVMSLIVAQKVHWHEEYKLKVQWWGMQIRFMKIAWKYCENTKIHFGEFGDRQRQLNLVTPHTLNFRNFVCRYHIICTRSLHGQCLPLMGNIFQSKPSEIRYWKHSFGSDVMIHVYKYWWQWWKWQCGYDVCCSNCS